MSLERKTGQLDFEKAFSQPLLRAVIGRQLAQEAVRFTSQYPGSSLSSQTQDSRELLLRIPELASESSPNLRMVSDGIRNGDPQTVSFVERSWDLFFSLYDTQNAFEKVKAFWQKTGDYRANKTWMMERVQAGLKGHLILYTTFPPESNVWLFDHLETEVSEQNVRGTQSDCFLAMSRFTDITEKILGPVFDTSDNSSFRQFLLNHFPAVFVNTCMVEDIRYYDPQKEYRRIQLLFDSVKPDKWALLADYLFYSSYGAFTKHKELLDTDIEDLDFTRVENFVQFHKKAYLKGDDLVPREGWVEKYLNGTVTKEEFLRIGECIKRVYEGFFSLPQAVRQQIDANWHGYAYHHTSGSGEKDGIGQILSCSDSTVRLTRAGVALWIPVVEELQKDQHALEEVLEFGRSLLDLADSGFPFYKVTTFWAKKVVEKEIGPDELSKIAKTLREVYLEIGEIMLSHVNPNVRSAYAQVFTQDIMRGDSNTISTLLKNGILPTPALLIFAQERGEQGFSDILALRDQIRFGRPDPLNGIQREVEFLNYIELIKPREYFNFAMVYEEFTQLQFQSEETRPMLTLPEQLEAMAASYEAALVYWLVKERVERGRRVIVIGNKRYGDLFVVSPLQRLLAELNATERKVAYVRSSSPAPGSIFEESSSEENFIASLVSSAPDVVVVDGTRSSFFDGKPRLPGSMVRFLNWFLAFNDAAGMRLPAFEEHQKTVGKTQSYRDVVEKIREFHPTQPYNIAFWVPSPAETVVVGGITLPYVAPSYELPQAILVNPVVDPSHIKNVPEDLKGHKAGFFDDPEGKVGKTQEQFVFTPTGVKKGINGRTLDQFVSLVQDQIESYLPVMLRRTDPAFAKR